MELAIKVLLLGACFFAGIYLITKLSDKLQQRNKDINADDTEENN